MDALNLLPDCIGLIVNIVDYRALRGLSMASKWLHALTAPKSIEIRRDTFETIERDDDKYHFKRFQYPNGFTTESVVSVAGRNYVAKYVDGKPTSWVMIPANEARDTRMYGDFDPRHPVIEVSRTGEDCAMSTRFADGTVLEVMICIAYPASEFRAEWSRDGVNFATGWYDFHDAVLDFKNFELLFKWYVDTIDDFEVGEEKLDVKGGTPVCWIVGGGIMTQEVYDMWSKDGRPDGRA